MNESEDLYEILQVHPAAHQEVVQAAFRRLTRLYHPDVNRSSEASTIMTRLNHAYYVLGDSDRRAAYDRARSAQQRNSPTGSGSNTDAYGRQPGPENTNRDTYSEGARDYRPESGPSSDSWTNYQTPVRENLRVPTLIIVAGMLGVIMVLFAVAAIAHFGLGGSSDGPPSIVALPPVSPTLVPGPAEIATKVPTPTATPYIYATWTPLPPIPTFTPRPAATSTPRPVPTPTPKPAPTATLAVAAVVPIGAAYFTRGSSQDDVLDVQGTPTAIDIYPASGFEDWSYGRSRVRISLADKRVTEWDNDGNLTVRLLPATSSSSTPGFFTRGSSQDDVLHVQGTPTAIDIYPASGFEDWSYGRSRVRISLADKRVTEWDNNGSLNVR